MRVSHYRSAGVCRYQVDLQLRPRVIGFVFEESRLSHEQRLCKMTFLYVGFIVRFLIYLGHCLKWI